MDNHGLILKEKKMELVLTGAMLILATINDIISRKIKNIIPFSFMIIGLIINSPTQSFFSCIMSAALFFVLYAIPNIIGINEFMGAGDVKLYMAMSYLMGWHFTLYAFVYSIFIGAFILGIINFKRILEISKNVYYYLTSKGKWHIDEKQEKTNIFAPYILLGAIAHQLININWII